MKKGLLILLMLGLAAPLWANDDEDHYDRVTLSVERAMEVENELMQATLAIEIERSDPAELADEINRTMAAALQRAKMASGVTIESGPYRTYPVSKKSRLVAWRGSQNLMLESRDESLLATLVGELQQSLVVKSINFTLLDETRRGYEDQLIAEALAAFSKRAELVQQSLGASGYRIVQINLNNQSNAPRPMKMRRSAMMAEAAPVAVEPGSSRITVHASGVIELQR